MGFKTNIVTSSVVAEGKIDDYTGYRKRIEAFAKNIFDKAPEPTPVIDTILKLVEDKNPKFNHPIGKGAPLLLGLQHFAYKTYEKAIIKDINKK
jgi:hypothetical protein